MALRLQPPSVDNNVRFFQVETVRFAQGLMGAKSPKPTDLLALRLPGLLRDLHAWRVRVELPRSATIGKNSQGAWNTAKLKEYPPSMCRALAGSFLKALRKVQIAPVPDPAVEDLNLWHQMNATTFGDCIGPDFAG
eukprot:s7_g91.t1